MALVQTILDNPAAAAVVVALAAVGYFYFASPKKGGNSKKSAASNALNADLFKSFKLKEKIIVSADTRIFRFALDSPTQTLGLPIGQHMYLRAVIDGQPVQRAYTPISSDDEKGYFDLLIKVYFKNVHPKFPDGGKMSQHLESLNIGDSIDVKGPIGRFEYLGHGKFQIKKGRDLVVPHQAKRFAMIAGGTGLTPMRQILQHIVKDPTDQTEVHLLFANQTEQDILLREELDTLAAKDKRVKIWYTVDRVPEGQEAKWKYSTGFISEPMLKEHFPAAEEGVYVLMCGPAPMITFACKPNLEKLGFKEDHMFSF